MEDILITTTSILQGYEIKKYLGLVTARLTIGTGIFTDFFASITDVVGGQSKSYEKELNELNSKCIELIKTETLKLYGNAVIGINIDYDEITGKGKQMFLITITGTAVKVAKVKNELEVKIEDIIDEFMILGETNDLKIKILKMNRMLKNVDYNNLNVDVKEKVFEFYKLSNQFVEAEKFLYYINKDNGIKLKEELIELYKVSKQYEKAEDIINKLIISSGNDFTKQALNKKLIEIYTASGQYSKAEDVLYELIKFARENEIEKYKDTLNYGIKFYEELLEQDDDSLNKGNLPRDEINDGLNQLKELIQ